MPVPPETPVPSTRTEPVVDVLHGRRVADPYRWLEDGDAADVTEWVAEQNARTRAFLDARPDRSAWSQRLTELMASPVILAAQARADVVAVLERGEGAAQSRLISTPLHVDVADGSRPSEVLIADPAAAGDDTVAIDWFHLSYDGSLVAYGVSEGGTENSVLRVARTADGSHLPDEIPNTRACSLAWEPDGSGFCYTRYPEGDEYHRTVHHHRLGDDWRHDPVVWAEHPTPQTWPAVDVSADGRYVLVTAMLDWSHDDVHLLDRRTGEWSVVVSGEAASTTLAFEEVEGADGSTQPLLLGTTTIGAPNGRVVSIDVERAADGPATWTTLVPERPGHVVGRAALAGSTLLVTVTRRATGSVERWPVAELRRAAAAATTEPDTIEPDTIEPDAIEPDTIDLGVVSVDGLSVDPRSGHAVAVTSGFTQPGTLWRIDGDRPVRVRPMGTGESADPALDRLTVSEVEYPSLDGTTIGMFVVHRDDVTPGVDTPTILTGYGGFAIALTPAWSATIAAWCESGGVYAVAGLRGGLEHGEEWHRAGKRANKQNVFDDFCAAADWLVSTGRTSRERLAIAGGSNGGLLVGAALTQRPDLCRAVWCAVPLLDMVRFPQFRIAQLWTEEYGDPDVAEEFEWLHAYSPYHRVVDGTCYPAVLLTTAEGDTRVDPLHARKMAARLQAASSCQHRRPVFLHQEGRAGHGQGKPVGKKVAEQADVLAFVTAQLGVGQPVAAGGV